MAPGALDRERIERVVRAMPALVGANAASQAADGPREKPDEISSKELLVDYFRVMEIAHYLRRGGVKAMIYRIETGRAQCAPNDYFDEAAERLCEAARACELPEQHGQPVLERLAAVSAEEEAVVREYLPRIDEILLSEKRKEAALSEE
jgi:hypothetical protein